MQIVEIEEPNQFKYREDLVVGIDFGTTNSLIAISNNYIAQVVKTRDDLELIPSVIGIKGNKLIVGKYSHEDEGPTVRSIKRFLAKSSQEIVQNSNLMALANCLDLSSSQPRIKVAETYVTLSQAASEIFKYLKLEAEAALNKPVKKAVVSVPAHFDDNAKGQVLLSAKLAGLEVIRLIAEPTAAAYAYGLHREQTGKYLVYDLGGGTFDVSILNMRTGILQVITTGGDNMLGGDDIDILLARYIAEKLEVPADEIILLAKKVKEDLSAMDFVEIRYNDISIEIFREEFEELVLPVIERTIKIVRDALHDADNIDLNGIILVGGSTRIPLIANLLQKLFKTKIYCDIDPEKVVAIGAALQAENLSSKPNSLLIDVVPLSIGMEIYGGIAEKIILRNTPIPFSVTKEFTTHSDNQTGMKFHILQGEREMVKDCRSLAHFELSGIQAEKAGKARIEVCFAIDADGILSVTAREARTGKAENIEIKPSYGISEEEIHDFLKTAYENASIDHEQRLLAETKLSATSLISGLERAIKDASAFIEENELIKIQEAITSLQSLVILDNQEKILVQMRILNSLSTSLIQKHLDKGLETYLKGRRIDEISKI